MPGLEHGIRRAIEELVINPVYFLAYMKFLEAFSAVIPLSQLLVIKIFIWIVNLLLNVKMLFSMEHWSTEYIIGWLIGVIIVAKYLAGPLWKIGVLDYTDVAFLVIYAIIPVVVIWRRLL